MYKPSEIDKLVFGKINEFLPFERVYANIGWVGLENPGIKHRPRYLNAYNFATEFDEIDYISQFIREANVDTVRDFYRQTNGMRLLCDKFGVPGVLFHRDDFEENDFYCVAIDFITKGGFALPVHTPEDGFLIGNSHRLKGDEWVRLYDILTKSGEIIGGYFDAASDVVDRFETIPEWISNRIDLAATDLKQEFKALNANG